MMENLLFSIILLMVILGFLLCYYQGKLSGYQEMNEMDEEKDEATDRYIQALKDYIQILKKEQKQ